MARAGHCAACGANVWLRDDGSCEQGHPAELISQHYEAPRPAEPASDRESTTHPKRKSRALVALGVVALVAVVFALCGLGAVALRPLVNRGSAAASEWNARLASDYPGWKKVGFNVSSFSGSSGSETTYAFALIPPGRKFPLGITYTSTGSAMPVSQDEVFRSGAKFPGRSSSLLDYIDANYIQKGRDVTAVTSDRTGKASVSWRKVRRILFFSWTTGSFDDLAYDQATQSWAVARSSDAFTPLWRSRVAKDFPGWKVVDFQVLNSDTDAGPATNYWVTLIPPGRTNTLGVNYTASPGGPALLQDEVLQSGGTFHKWAPQLLTYLDDHYYNRGIRTLSISTEANDGSAYVSWEKPGDTSTSADQMDVLELDMGKGTWSLSP